MGAFGDEAAGRPWRGCGAASQPAITLPAARDEDGAPMRHQIRLLGGPELLVDGAPVPIGSAKQWAVLATLALEAGTVVPAGRLVDVLWGDEPPPSAGTTVRGLVHRLRRTLGDGADALHGQGSGYVLAVPADVVDAAAFEQRAAAGREALARAELLVAAEHLRAAVRLWRGPALGELAGLPAFAATASRLDAALLDVTEDLVEAELALGRPGDALARVEAHLAVAPLRERAWGQLMLALYRLGRQADALAAYQRVRRALDSELGIEASPALRDIQKGILAQRPELLMPRPAPAPRAEGDTVAFLFTDIESSTRRWEGEADAMAADLAAHDKLLTQACESHGGRVFSHTGDGLCAAFGTAAAAVAAAVAGQFALADESWEGAEPLRVRMAVHVGAAEARGGNYFGPTLNRTARLLSAAWGGQIVCSLATAELTDDQLPAEVSLRDLGEQRLADLARPERVFQVLHAGLPDEFPALRTAAAVRHNLPVALTSFVGRGAELTAVADALSTSRLVSLVGPGGAGKTRLALAAAAAVAREFPDGVWLVELAPIGDPDQLAATVARATGMDPAASVGQQTSVLDAIAAQFRARRALLVFDNCEHLVREAARVVHHLLRHCPDLAVLATSRESLAVGGETVVRVGGLSLPPLGAACAADLADSDAVALFCARATEASPGFALTDTNAAAITRIAHRLDGIALALELAAPRLRMIGAAQLAERLDDRFRLLAGGPHSADPRHQTLLAALDWSHDLLPQDERIVLRRLAVFPAGFSLAAAEAVSAGGADFPGPHSFDLLDLLGRLADKSMVTLTQTEGEEVRYRLLETVREYASGKLADAGETAAVRTRHRSFFTVEENWHVEAHAAYWLHWCAAEDDNVKAALAWAAGEGDERAMLRLVAQQWTYWFYAGDPRCIEWLERAVSVPGPADVANRVLVRCGLGHMWHTAAADADSRLRAADLLAEAVALAEECDDHVSAAWARTYTAHLLGLEGRNSAAMAIYDVALPVLLATGDAFSVAFLNAMIADIVLAEGDLARARDLNEQAARALEGYPDNYMAVHVLAHLALTEAALRLPEKAGRNAVAAVAAARRLHGGRALVMTLVRLAQVAVLADSAGDARPALDELLGLLRELGIGDWVAETLELTALVVADTAPEAAVGMLGAASATRGARAEASLLPMLDERVAASARELNIRVGDERFADLRASGATTPAPAMLARARALLRG